MTKKNLNETPLFEVVNSELSKFKKKKSVFTESANSVESDVVVAIPVINGIELCDNDKNINFKNFDEWYYKVKCGMPRLYLNYIEFNESRINRYNGKNKSDNYCRDGKLRSDASNVNKGLNHHPEHEIIWSQNHAGEVYIVMRYDEFVEKVKDHITGMTSEEFVKRADYAKRQLTDSKLQTFKGLNTSFQSQNDWVSGYIKGVYEVNASWFK